MEIRQAHFAVEGGLVAVVGGVAANKDQADASLRELLGGVTFVKPPLSEDELPMGHIEAQVGYSIDLAEGWRTLTRLETLAMSVNNRIRSGMFKGKAATKRAII